MKNSLLITLLMISSQLVSAQIGIKGTFNFNDAPDWILVDEFNNNQETTLINNGFSFGVDYWFRLPDQRVEFLPELNFYRSETIINSKRTIEARFYSFFLNTNLYFLDFLSDCDCPTFSKQGDALDNGLFIQVTPGMSIIQQEINLDEDIYSSESYAFSIGAALGLDLGISDFFTITPMMGVRYYPSATWDELDNITIGYDGLSMGEEKTAIFQYYAAIRLGLRFDNY